MAIQHPPRHRVDAPPVYIWEGDQAWKHDEIKAEEAEVRRINAERERAALDAGADAWERIDWSRHPVALYRSGETRFDLTAATLWRGEMRTAMDWIDESKAPVKFVLRRVSWDEWYLLSSVLSPQRQCAMACQMGLVAVENDKALAVDGDRKHRSDEEMQRLFNVHHELPVLIGGAVIKASKPLSDGEKKP